MNNFSHHDLCPICRAGIPSPALPAHLHAHHAAAFAANLSERSTEELIDIFRVEVWAELEPIREWRAVGIAEAMIERLERLSQALADAQRARWAAEQDAAHWRERAEEQSA